MDKNETTDEFYHAIVLVLQESSGDWNLLETGDWKNWICKIKGRRQDCHPTYSNVVFTFGVAIRSTSHFSIVVVLSFIFWNRGIFDN